ncbi:MAG: hypothetical protein ACRCUY_12045 [Thermoguttaceae bacterium]
MKTRSFILGFVLLLTIVSGCGKGLVPFGGKVTFPDGKPLTTGVVVFSTSTFQADGNLNEQGEYQLGSIGVNDGLPAGTYKVTVMGAQITDDKERSTQLINADFADTEKTPLSCEVKSGVKRYDFTVEYPKK